MYLTVRRLSGSTISVMKLFTKRNSIRKSFAFLSTQMVEKEELDEEDRPL
jgi:hypothetical protein